MTKKYERSRTKKQILFFSFILFVLCFTVTIILRLNYGDFLDDFPKALDYLKIPDDVSCYHEDYGKPDPLGGIPKHAIFLISASCESGLSLHHACAVEAVTRAHIDKQIFVFINRPLKDCKCYTGLQEGLNSIPALQFVRIQIDKFVENTPLEGIFKNGFLDIGVKKHKRITEILKFVTLYKFGGVVIDLDMIIAKPVTFLGLNYAVRVNRSMLGSAVVSFNKNSLLAKQLIPLVLLKLKNQSQEREISGGQALTEAFKLMCYEHPAVGCTDFRIYDQKYFYPYNETSNYMYAQNGNLDPIAYGYNVWDSRGLPIRRLSVYSKLMREYCPSVLSYL